MNDFETEEIDIPTGKSDHIPHIATYTLHVGDQWYPAPGMGDETKTFLASAANEDALALAEVPERLANSRWAILYRLDHTEDGPKWTVIAQVDGNDLPDPTKEEAQAMTDGQFKALQNLFGQTD